MQQITDQKLLDVYIRKFHIEDCFSDLEICRPYMKLVYIPERTSIYTDMQYARYIYFIVDGKYKVYGNLADGKRILYRFCSAFSILGEMEFILDREKAAESNSVETVNSCTAVLLDYMPIIDMLRKDNRFLMFLCQCLAEKAAYFGNMQMINSLQSAEEKTALYLLSCVNDDGYFCENRGIMAEELSISYRHLHRVLKKFADSGWIERQHGGYKILRPDVMRAQFLK